MSMVSTSNGVRSARQDEAALYQEQLRAKSIAIGAPGLSPLCRPPQPKTGPHNLQPVMRCRPRQMDTDTMLMMMNF